MTPKQIAANELPGMDIDEVFKILPWLEGLLGSVHRAGLEDAAGLCEANGDSWSDKDPVSRDACYRCADDIRARIGQGETDGR